MLRGEVRLVDLEPVRGSEADEQHRPDVPQVLLTAEDTGLSRDSEAQAEQLRSVAVERVGTTLGRLPGSSMAALDDAMRLHLGL